MINDDLFINPVLLSWKADLALQPDGGDLANATASVSADSGSAAPPSAIWPLGPDFSQTTGSLFFCLAAAFFLGYGRSTMYNICQISYPVR